MRRLNLVLAIACLVSMPEAGAVATAGIERHGAEQACLRSVLALHAGSVDRIRSRIVKEELQVRIDLTKRDGSEWVVVCTGVEGKLVRSVRVDED